MSLLATPPLSLYVHFPWCVRKCPYCDFNSYTLSGELAQQPYLERLGRDLAAQAPGVTGRTVQSVFLGGGTPSLFSPETIGQLLAPCPPSSRARRGCGSHARGQSRHHRARGVR